MCNETKVLDPIFNKRLESWEETYHLIKGYAIAKKMTNTLIALSVALRIHEGQMIFYVLLQYCMIRLKIQQIILQKILL